MVSSSKTKQETEVVSKNTLPKDKKIKKTQKTKDIISSYSMSGYLSNLSKQKQDKDGFNRKAQNYCECLVAISTILTEYYVDTLLNQAKIEKRNRTIKKCIAEFKKEHLESLTGLTRVEIKEYVSANFTISNKEIQEKMDEMKMQIGPQILERGVRNNKELYVLELKAQMNKNMKMRNLVIEELNNSNGNQNILSIDNIINQAQPQPQAVESV